MISVIIPVFNEESCLIPLYDRLKSTLNLMGEKYEFIFVNDCSSDSSQIILQSLSSQDPQVKYISFSRNFGHQIAVSAGLEHCSGDAIVIIDADLQDPPELIKDLYLKYSEGFDVVYAKRKKRDGEGAFKTWTAKLFYRILRRLTSIEIPLDTGDFRIMSKKVNMVLSKMPEKQKFLRGQIAWIGFKQSYVEYDRLLEITYNAV